MKSHRVPHYTEDPAWEWEPGGTLHTLSDEDVANATGKPEDLPMPADMQNLKWRVSAPGEPRLAAPNRMRDLLVYPEPKSAPSFAALIVPALIATQARPKTAQELFNADIRDWGGQKFTREFMAEVPDEWLPPEGTVSTVSMGYTVMAHIRPLEVEDFEAEDKRILELLETATHDHLSIKGGALDEETIKALAAKLDAMPRPNFTAPPVGATWDLADPHTNPKPYVPGTWAAGFKTIQTTPTMTMTMPKPKPDLPEGWKETTRKPLEGWSDWPLGGPEGEPED